MKRVGLFFFAATAIGLISPARQGGALALAQGPASSGRAATSSTSTREADFESLFDGRTLKGWKQFGGDPKVWTVEKGSLVMLGEGGGWLGTGRTYRDFELELEFKLTPGSNSGVYLRAPADDTRISRTGMEIQLLDDPHVRYKDIMPWQKTGALYHVAAPLPGHLKPVGEWNRLGLRLEGKRLVVMLNGVKVVEDRLDSHPDLEKEHPGLKRTEGLIGLQSHNGRVDFREIRVRDLSPLQAGPKNSTSG